MIVIVYEQNAFDVLDVFDYAMLRVFFFCSRSAALKSDGTHIRAIASRRFVAIWRSVIMIAARMARYVEGYIRDKTC